MPFLTPFSVYPYESDDPSKFPDKPKKAVVLEVEMDASTRRIHLKFSNVWKSKDSFSNHQDFKTWIKGFVSDIPAPGKFIPKDKTPGHRKPTDMSLKSKDFVYLVFKLSDNWDWRFAADGYPISQEKKWKNSGVFVGAKHLGNDGVETDAGLGKSGKFAYIIADCEKAKPNDLGGNIEGRFNLHVDIIEDILNSETSPYIPLIIDPDVRYPGGNEPE